MKITYNENPLRTVVELDDHDRQIFWFKLKVEELQDRLYDVHFNLTEGKYFNIDHARKVADPDYYIQEDDGEKTPIDKRVDRLLESHTEELQGVHCGDCICVACSCMKCHAEGILGIDTLKPSPGCHALHKIDAAFSTGRSLAEAIAHLRDHKIDRQKPEDWKSFTQEQYESHVPRWEAEQTAAYEYLKKYAEEHG